MAAPGTVLHVLEVAAAVAAAADAHAAAVSEAASAAVVAMPAAADAPTGMLDHCGGIVSEKS